MLMNLLWVLHILICIVLIITVLLQAGKGAAAGFSFGGGASQTVFGSSGGKNFFARVTTALAICFMITSIVLSIASSRSAQSYRGVMKQLPQSGSPAVPEKLPAAEPINQPAEKPVNTEPAEAK